MSGRERTYRPRARTTRPLGEPRSANAPPSQPLSPPEKRGDGWLIPDPLAQRLHQKSGLGKRTKDGILLTAEEVLFCHWYRHVPLPSDDEWFRSQLHQDGTLLRRIIAMDVLRNGGERVVPVDHLNERFESFPKFTWAVRWERHESWMSHTGFSQVRLQRTHDPLDWDELDAWVDSVNSLGHVAELCVIDDEFDTTVYHLSRCHPNGSHVRFSDLDEEQKETIRASCNAAQSIDDGFFLNYPSDWPLPAIGIPHFSGRYLRNEEHTFLNDDDGEGAKNLYGALIEQGLLLRPGFKYGCRWRAYEDSIEAAHAPWLIQPLAEAPANWEEVCLAVRLAEGVNKRWVCARFTKGASSFLNIKRVG